jgi:hypothetical protein
MTFTVRKMFVLPEILDRNFLLAIVLLALSCTVSVSALLGVGINYSGIRLTRISRDQKNLFLLKAFCVK